ncbi:MAG TPA: aminotransferase class V-fold PLP-dependent enzyme [Candidatus Cybelea sp.]|nr:aminotransferase class V-fold PLP-dependent enzyme [Candidatus Cybelea sp.]
MTTPLPRSEFAVTQRYLYLNHAAAGVLPASTIAAIEEFARAHAAAGVLGTFPYDLKMVEYREKIGRFIGARGADIATIPNTSAGAGTIALGVDWKPGDEVLLGDDEFPANVVPWLALRERGVEVRLLPVAQERLTPQRLKREISGRTRVVTCSWVSYFDGYRHDLAALGAIAHDAGALFCVDAIQGLGALPLDVGALEIDALYCGAGKWMLGLHGAAFLYLSPGVASNLRIAAPGWRSLADMWDFHNYDQPYTHEALRFEGGTPNLLGTLSLASAIDLFDASGRAAIAAHILMLTDRFYAGARELGATFSTQRGEGRSSGIVTFAIPGCDSIALGQALEKEGIVTTYRTGGIRVSPHGYTTIEEIDDMIDAVARLGRASRGIV